MEELEKYLDEQCLMESELEKVSLLAYLTIKIIWIFKIEPLK